jgi:hypothetical protein
MTGSYLLVYLSTYYRIGDRLAGVGVAMARRIRLTGVGRARPREPTTALTAVGDGSGTVGSEAGVGGRA